jgi:hypothetical protein
MKTPKNKFGSSSFDDRAKDEIRPNSRTTLLRNAGVPIIALGGITVILGLWYIGSSECGGLLHIKPTDSGYELLVDKRNCKLPGTAVTPNRLSPD